MVRLSREPGNEYDRNAIRVDNIQGVKVGHLPKTIVSKLAKYIDDGSIRIEGFIAGEKGFYNCPIDLRFYGTNDPKEQEILAKRLKKDGFPLDAYMRTTENREKERLEDLRRAGSSFGPSSSQSSRSMPIAGSSSQSWGIHSSQPFMSSQATDPWDEDDLSDTDLQQILLARTEVINPRKFEEVKESFGLQEAELEKMPKAHQPKGLITQLLPFQLQGLQWMIDKENPKLPPKDSNDDVQLWIRDQRDRNLFKHMASLYSTKSPPLAKGGILADDMGLGKTIQVISLIAQDKVKPPKLDPKVSLATLIVSPVSVMSNWTGQMKAHVKPEHELRILRYHGSGRKRLTAEILKDYDVVITSYAILAQECPPPTAPGAPPPKDGIHAITWRRVVLDEGHIIRNAATKNAKAAHVVPAVARWALTGTPIVNSLKDLHSLVRFIGYGGGIAEWDCFNRALVRPVMKGEESGFRLLQKLMGGACLRRKKEMKFVDLRLPELTDQVYRVDFLPHEQEIYDKFKDQADSFLGQVVANRGSHQVEAKSQKAYQNLLEVLLRLRQVCNHWQLCSARVATLMNNISLGGTVERTPENRAALQEALQLVIDSQDDCPVCMDNFNDPVITHCAHSFCYSCIERVIETQAKCPMCRAPLENTGYLVRPARELGESKASDAEIDKTSSKVEALFEILKVSHKTAGTKTVIFSQWTSFLDIIQNRLAESGTYRLTRIDGSMPVKRRDAAIEAFSTESDCTILLASLAVANVGLNLVAANQVILADTWWAPAIEDQAVDRIHRMGQTKPTTVWRLVVDNTIEERVLNIQQEKRKLMMLALQEREGKRKTGKETRLADIQRLLGPAPVAESAQEEAPAATADDALEDDEDGVGEASDSSSQAAESDDEPEEVDMTT